MKNGDVKTATWDTSATVA